MALGKGRITSSFVLAMPGLLLVSLAGLDAGAAGFGALLAMLVLVLTAFVGALLADFETLLENMLGVVRAAGDEGVGEAADVGTVAVEADAGHHHLDIILVQAGGGAHFAGGDAAGEGVENLLVLGGGSVGLVHTEME